MGSHAGFADVMRNGHAAAGGGFQAFAIVAGVYLAAPLFDLLMGRDKGAWAPSPARARPVSLLCRLALWFWAPTQAAFIVWALVVVTRAAAQFGTEERAMADDQDRQRIRDPIEQWSG